MGYAKLAKKRSYLASRLLAEMTGRKNTGMRENGLLQLGLQKLRKLLESASTVDNLDGLKYLTQLMPYAMPKVTDNAPLQALLGQNQDGSTTVYLQVNNYLEERKQALQSKLGQVDRAITGVDKGAINNSGIVNGVEDGVKDGVECGVFSEPPPSSPILSDKPNNPKIQAQQHPSKNTPTKQPKQAKNGN